MKTIASFIFIILAIASPSAFAATGEVFYQPNYPDFINPRSSFDINLMDNDLQSELLRFSIRKERDQKIYDQWVPDDGIGRKQNDSFALKRLFDKGLKRVMKSSFFKNSSLGRTSENLKEKMHTNVEFSDEKNMSHKFDFAVELFQGYAQVQYTGFTKAKLRYQASNKRVMMVFEHNLSKYQSMAIETALTGPETTQFVTLNCRW